MQLFCPTCKTTYPSFNRCPRCGGLLLMPHEVAADAPQFDGESPAPIQTTAVGRIMVGTVLALGVYLGVRKVLAATILAANGQGTEWWLSFHGLSIVYALQAGAVLFGAVIAAAGRASGYSIGFLIGLCCGGLFLGYELLAGASPQTLVLYLQPPVLALLGLAGGVAGSRVWTPMPDLKLPIPTGSKLSSLQLGEDLEEEKPKPTQWIRVLAGAAIMVIGVVAAEQVRHTLQKNSGGLLKVDSMGQGDFITWQLATLAVLTGGVVAGAATGAGIRHGILSGFVGAGGLIGICMKMGGALPPIEYWLSKMSLDGLPLMAPTVLTAIGGGVMLLALLGGWLGGALFQILAPESMRKRTSFGLD
jgi:hypothetical protein